MSSGLEERLAEVMSEIRALRREVGVQKRLYSMEDAATAWSVSLSKVKQMVREKRVLTTEIDGRRLVPVSEIDRIAKPKVVAKPPKTRGAPKRAGRYDLQAELAAAKALTKKKR